MKKCLIVGGRAPNFITTAIYQNQIGRIRLSDYLEKKYVILLFYPLNSDFLLTKDLLRLNLLISEFQDNTTQIIVIAGNNSFSNFKYLQLIQTNTQISYLRYPLVCDLNQKIAKKYQLLTNEGFTIPSFLIIDKNGIIQYHVTYNILYRKNINEIYKILRFFKSLKDQEKKKSS